MRRAMTRRLLLDRGAVLAGTGLAAAAAACGPFGPTESDRPQSIAGKVQLVHRQDPVSKPVYAAIGEDFRTRNPMIEVEFVELATGTGAEGYQAPLFALIAAGTAPDVFWQEATWFANWAHQGVLFNMDRLARRDAKAAQLDDIFPGILDIGRLRGGLYGLPADGSGTNLFYNVGLFEREGLQAPGALQELGRWRVESFLDASKKLTRRGDGGDEVWGAYDPFPFYAWWLPWVWAWGGDLLSKDGTQVLLDQPAAAEALQWQQDLITRHGVTPTSDELVRLTQRGQPSDRRGMFRNGRVAMITDFPTAVGAGQFREAEQRGLRWDGTLLPAGKVGQFSISFFHQHCMAAATKAPEPAWRVLTFFSGPEADLRKSIAGNTQPFRKSTSAAQQYLRTLPPNFARSIPKLGDRSRPFPQVVEGQRMREVLGEEMQQFRDGKKSVREMTQSVKQRLTPLLKTQL